MIPYFVVLSFIIVFAAADQVSKNNTWKVLVFILFALFGGLRYNVGVDYDSYSKLFNQVDGYTMKEPGGYIIMSFLRMIGGTQQLYFLFMSSITQYFVYKTLKRIKKGFWLSVIVYYCVSLFYIASFNAVRQYVAIAIITYSLILIEKQQFSRFCIAVILTSCFFHLSVFIFLPLYFFLNKRHSIWTLLIITLAIFGMNNIMNIILSYTPYLGYMDGFDKDIKVQTSQYLFALFSFIMIIIGNKFSYLRENYVLYNMNCICFYTLLLVVLQSAGTMIMMFQRFNSYFIFSYLLIIPAIILSMGKQLSRIAQLFVLSISFTYMMITIIHNGERYMLVPYDYSLSLFNF